jgi:hypothetical protein
MLSAASLVLLLFYLSCSSDDAPEPFDCDTSDLEIDLVSSTDPESCTTNNGSIVVEASLGKSPYQFKLNSGSFGSSATFSGLSAGSYTVTVKDANGCEAKLLNIVLTAPSGPVAGASVVLDQTNCLAPNGSITVNVTEGTPPYQYKLGTGPFGASATFANLKAGSYTITVEDDAGCVLTINESIDSNTDVSYANDIAPILQANCIKAGCHNGDNGADKNWSVFSNVQAKAQLIKLRTGNKSMPQDIAPTGLPQNQITLIACWVDDGAQNN